MEQSKYTMLKEMFSARMDDRMALLVKEKLFTGIVGTIAEREPEDAIRVIFQAMLATLENPTLSYRSYCGDLIVYAISPYREEFSKIEGLEKMSQLMSEGEKSGILLWLELAVEMDFGRLCASDIDRAIMFWESRRRSGKMDPSANQ